MTLEDAKLIAERLCLIYQRPSDANSTNSIASVWLAVFRSEPGAEVWETIVDYLRDDDSGFMPTPGKIHAAMLKRRKRAESKKTELAFTRSWQEELYGEDAPEPYADTGPFPL